ncbi:esterase [Bdellovibrio bacteriovorus]|uniref:Esterase n=1 Tax=Bdellovibrio bacteriovorus TaxID=959 RepID=A0A162H301_BDEBC|nr:alpha/beta fold hydrolase [Bdellovibrio bacteriovorus]KYG69541.1 esterase [Bdellovibrio bacteriovorus]
MTSLSVEFTERMSGFVVPKKFVLSPGKPLSHSDFLIENDRFDKQPFEFTVTIKVPNLDKFLDDHSTPSQMYGRITDFRFREELRIEKGYFQLFTLPAASPHFDTVKEMHYTLFLTDREGKKWTFFGYKAILKEDLSELWNQTTTLYYYLWEGHSPFDNYSDKEVHAIGSLRISLSDFLTQMKSFKTNASSFLQEKEALMKYFKAFTDTLWESYAPFIFTTTSARWNEHQYPMHTTQGVALGEKTLHPLDTRDGLTISVQRFKHQESKNVVLLLHGLTTSTDMFIMPEHQNLVNQLHASGYSDVWSLDWRGSGRFTYNMTPHRYTIDDVAKYDIPRAVDFIRESCGNDVKIHVIAHCVGSLSFMASYAAGYVKNIASIVANSVSLTPMVPWQAMAKMMVGPEILGQVLGYPYVSPKIPYHPGRALGRWLYWMERSLRRECKEPACHMVSFMWGWGFPAAFNHRNIHPVTHRRLMDLFGGTSFHYHKHIRKMLLAKASISFDSKTNYLEEMKKRDMPPTLLISGAENHIFPNSNKTTYEILSQTKNASKVSYKEFTNYGHQDIFMGQYCHNEVFPELIEFLKQHSGISGVETRKLRIA